MKARYRLFRRGTTFYAEDIESGKQESLRTKDATEAARLLAARNEVHAQPQFCLQLARTYLLGGDPQIASRTWADVMREAALLKTGQTKLRWERAVQQTPFDLIRHLVLIETRA